MTPVSTVWFVVESGAHLIACVVAAAVGEADGGGAAEVGIGLGVFLTTVCLLKFLECEPTVGGTDAIEKSVPVGFGSAASDEIGVVSLPAAWIVSRREARCGVRVVDGSGSTTDGVGNRCGGGGDGGNANTLWSTLLWLLLFGDSVRRRGVEVVVAAPPAEGGNFDDEPDD